MRNIWRRFWPYAVVLLVWVLVAVALCSCDRALKRENEKLRQELAHAQQYVPLQRDTIRDTVQMVTQQIVEIEKVKEALSKEDKQLLEDMNAKISAIESFQKIGMSTEASVTLSPDTSITDAEDKGSSQHQDSMLAYHDAWLDLRYNMLNNNLAIRLQDSLAIAVEKEYKKRFLWWKWGTKGYQVKAVSFCPYTTIRYNTYIKKKR